MVLVAGKMYMPTDIAVDTTTDSVFVVEQFNHRISRWGYTAGNHTFTLDTSWGDKSPADGTTGVGAPIGDGGPTDLSLYRPTGIVFDSTRLVVTDTFHNRIRTINPVTGAFIDSVGSGGFGTANFYHPAGIATNGTHLVIADELNHRAVRYDVGATPSSPILLPEPTGVDVLKFNRPHGVIFDIMGTTFDVTDSFHGVINRYNSTATAFVDQIGTPGTEGIKLFFPGSGNGILTGNSSTTFADTRNNILKTIATTTIANTTGTSPGTGNGQLYYPESVVSFSDTANYVLAANTRNNRVEAYSNVAKVLTFESNFGSP